jgi:hypothetical protein
MAMVPIFSERREISPCLLERSVCLEIREKKIEQLLYIRRELSQTPIHLSLDADLIFHGVDNITCS